MEPASSSLPKLVAFDLDGTLWDPEMYLLDGEPYKRSGRNTVLTRRGEEVHLIGQSHAILYEMATNPAWKHSVVAYVSRTTEPAWAKTCLRLLQVTDSLNLDEFGKLQEIYPGNKRAHFQRIHKQTGIAYSDMLFFDNERRNCVDVARLGVTCIYTPDGMTLEHWLEGLKVHSNA